MSMTKTEFRALNKADTLELLREVFEDDGEFEEMNADELTQFGIDHWEDLFEEEDSSDDTEDEGEDSSDEVPDYALDLGAIHPTQRAAARAKQAPPTQDLG